MKRSSNQSLNYKKELENAFFSHQTLIKNRWYTRPLWRLIIKIYGIEKVYKFFTVDMAPATSARELFSQIIRGLNMPVEVRGNIAIDATQPLIVIANHPTGIFDGVGVLEQLLHYRAHARVMINSLIPSIPTFEPHMLRVNVYGGTTSHMNVQQFRKIIRYLREENGCIFIMPSGSIAKFKLSRWQIEEGPWRENITRLIATAQVPVLPIHIKARNSLMYYVIAFLNGNLSTPFLLREFFRTAKKPKTIVVGEIIQPTEYQQIPLAERTQFFRDKVLSL